MKTLGDHLRKRRLDLGLWQRTVAERLGVREETVTLWESGLARPLARHYGRIVQFLGYDPEPGDSTLPGRLRAVRRRLGLSQAELAAVAGLDEGSVCRWESGNRQPCRWMVSRVTAILDQLEKSAAEPGTASEPHELQHLSYFDRTRWRRRPPSDLTVGGTITIGDQLRQRRLELGLTQAQLGSQFGVSRGTLQRWERGATVPPGRCLTVDRFLRPRAAQRRRPRGVRGHRPG